jgi:hypothetical protein
VPQIHGQDCWDDEGHQRHQNCVISGKKIGDGYQPYT